MKRVMINDRGYSLLLAIGILLIVSILGMSLMTLTTSGILKNETRENTVQAKDLSEKGIDLIVNNIQKKLADSIKVGITSNDFPGELESTLDELRCPKGIEIPGEDTDITKTCIENYVTNESDYKREVTFKSIGIVDGKQHISRFVVIIGADAVPDPLRYAVSTNNGGDLFLHGGVEIIGDVKTEGNLILSNKAHRVNIFGQRVWEKSVSPKIIQISTKSSPKLIMKNSEKYIYTFAETSLVNYNNHIEGKDFTKSFYTKYNPNEKEKTIKSVSNFLLDSRNLSIETQETLYSDQMDITKTIESNYNPSNQNNYSEYNPSLLLNKPRFSKNDVIFVGEKCKSSCKFKKGDMELDGWSLSKTPIDLQGNYYVYGDLTIKDINLKSDAIFFVKGKVTISNSIINGKGKTNTLIIFAEDDIKISNISEYTDATSTDELKGFFFTKENLEIYGMASNIKIKGGISANRINLTALRGDVKWSAFDYVVPESENNQRNSYSRLKIIYDENLINAYTSFDRTGDLITTLNDPEIIERK